MNILKWKWFKYVLYGLGLLVLAAAIFTALDYKKYKDYQQSRFFGSQDVVPQDQSLFYDGLKFTITGVEHKEYFPPIFDCEEVLDSTLSLYEGSSLSPLERRLRAVQSDGYKKCNEQQNRYRNRKNVTIHYFIENTLDEPKSISGYSAKIIGSDDIENNKPEPVIADLLADQSRYSKFDLNTPKEAKDFALVVEKDNQQKQINIELPKLQER